MARNQNLISPDRPSIYLDQWVWIHLAQAANGRPREPGDTPLLEAVRRASTSGVCFPLSSTHYIETSRARSHKRRSEVTAVMASVSHCRTLAPRHVLMRTQILNAMHEAWGRPMFRPEKPQVIGVGVHWAFQGKQYQLNVHGPDGLPLPPGAVIPIDVTCRLSQWAEIQFLTGPRDEEIETLRQQHGYRPEKTE
jgi:hypothetical protein